MDFKIGDVCHGFRLIDEREIKEINSVARLFRHEQSGARLLSLSNDDDNKVFAISFRTPTQYFALSLSPILIVRTSSHTGALCALWITQVPG